MTMDQGDDQSAPSEKGVFTDHFVLYLDFLGVSDAAARWDDERTRDLISVLQTIAAARAPFAIDGESLPDGSYKIKMTSETSTFSDHIVASYPMIQDPRLPPEFFVDMYLKLAQDMVSKIAVEALNVGVLVRGGITIGKLFHSGGVVFGEAMLDAYRLESRVAIYPRVVVSSRVLARLESNLSGRLLRDFDGIWHLNYFGQLAGHVAQTERNDWHTARLALIDKNILELGVNEKCNEFAKWSWFREQFATHFQ